MRHTRTAIAVPCYGMLLHQIGISSRVCAFVYCVAILYASFERNERRSSLRLLLLLYTFLLGHREHSLTRSLVSSACSPHFRVNKFNSGSSAQHSGCARGRLQQLAHSNVRRPRKLGRSQIALHFSAVCPSQSTR